MQHYQLMKAASIGPQQPLIFKDDVITLDVPKEGCTCNHEGWILFPAITPMVKL